MPLGVGLYFSFNPDYMTIGFFIGGFGIILFSIFLKNMYKKLSD